MQGGIAGDGVDDGVVEPCGSRDARLIQDIEHLAEVLTDLEAAKRQSKAVVPRRRELEYQWLRVMDGLEKAGKPANGTV